MSPTPPPPNPSQESLDPFFKVLLAIVVLGAVYCLFVTRFIAPTPPAKPSAETTTTKAPGDTHPAPAKAGMAAEAEEPASAWSVRGQFGDMFGGLNALFSGVTVAGLLYTLHLQRKAMEQQARSLSLQRESIEQQERALRCQQESLDASMVAFKEQSRSASEATALQACIALREQWNEMSADERISTEVRKDLIRQVQKLTEEIIQWRETHSRRVSASAEKPHEGTTAKT